MKGRMSNRDRIAHLRAEADATAKEKATEKAEKAARPPASKAATDKSPTGKSATGKSPAKTAKPKSGSKVRIVWFVCDPSGREVQRFPYAKEQEAREAALQQSTATGRTYFVKQADVPA